MTILNELQKIIENTNTQMFTDDDKVNESEVNKVLNQYGVPSLEQEGNSYTTTTGIFITPYGKKRIPPIHISITRIDGDYSHITFYVEGVRPKTVLKGKKRISVSPNFVDVNAYTLELHTVIHAIFEMIVSRIYLYNGADESNEDEIKKKMINIYSYSHEEVQEIFYNYNVMNKYDTYCAGYGENLTDNTNDSSNIIWGTPIDIDDVKDRAWTKSVGDDITGNFIANKSWE